MEVEVIPKQVSPETVEKLQADVAQLKQEGLDREQALTELKERVDRIEQVTPK